MSINLKKADDFDKTLTQNLAQRAYDAIEFNPSEKSMDLKQDLEDFFGCQPRVPTLVCPYEIIRIGRSGNPDVSDHGNVEHLEDATSADVLDKIVSELYVPLVPGDVIVLCSEERYVYSPYILGDINWFEMNPMVNSK